MIDLETLEVTETIAVPMATEYFYNTAEILVGSGNILYYTDSHYQPRLQVFDRGTKQVIQTLLVDGFNGFGDIVLDSTKQTLIAWAQYGGGHTNSTSSDQSGLFHRYAVSESGILSRLTDENPVKIEAGEAPMLISNDDQNFFFQNLILSPANISTVTTTLPAPIRSISPGGEIAVTADSIYRVTTGSKVADLPIGSSVQAITSDYSHLVFFNEGAKRIESLNLVSLVGTQVLGRVLSPQPDASVAIPTTLSWSSQPGATVYLLYLGDTRGSVETATPESPLYRGFSLTSSIAAPAGLESGATYYWRVDTVFGEVTSKGAVYSFSTSPTSTMPAPVLSAGANTAGTSVDVTWTDNTGTFSCRGRLVRFQEGNVRLLKDNGRTTTVPLARLSTVDLEFVNRQASALQRCCHASDNACFHQGRIGDDQSTCRLPGLDQLPQFLHAPRSKHNLAGREKAPRIARHHGVSSTSNWQ